MIVENPKFIIKGDELRIGRVGKHEELAGNDDSDVKGGGWWHYDKETNILYLYGSSFDYGQVKAEDFEDIWVQPSLENAKIFFSLEESLNDARKNNLIIQDCD